LNFFISCFFISKKIKKVQKSKIASLFATKPKNIILPFSTFNIRIPNFNYEHKHTNKEKDEWKKNNYLEKTINNLSIEIIS